MTSEQLKEIKEVLMTARDTVLRLESILKKEAIESDDAKWLIELWNCIFNPKEYSDYDSIINEFKEEIPSILKHSDIPMLLLNNFHRNLEGVFDMFSLDIENWEPSELRIIQKRMKRLKDRYAKIELMKRAEKMAPHIKKAIVGKN